jgi:hypothetical protein
MAKKDRENEDSAMAEGESGAEAQRAPTMAEITAALEYIKNHRLSSDATDTQSQILANLAEIAKQQHQVQKAQLKQTAPKSNQAGPKRSHFNPQGEKDYPMPELKCIVHMPFPQRPGLHGMDWEEVELMNLVRPGEYLIELNDGMLTALVITGRMNHESGKLEEMLWSGRRDPDSGHPTPFFTSSNRSQFPPLRVILRQVLGDPGAFRDEENRDRFGREDSPALDVMTNRIRDRKVKQYIAAEDKEAALAAGALPISLGE